MINQSATECFIVWATSISMTPFNIRCKHTTITHFKSNEFYWNTNLQKHVSQLFYQIFKYRTCVNAWNQYTEDFNGNYFIDCQWTVPAWSPSWTELRIMMWPSSCAKIAKDTSLVQCFLKSGNPKRLSLGRASLLYSLIKIVKISPKCFWGQATTQCTSTWIISV